MVDIFGSFHSVRRHLEGPGDNQRDGKPSSVSTIDRRHDAIWKIEDAGKIVAAICMSSQPTTA